MEGGRERGSKRERKPCTDDISTVSLFLISPTSVTSPMVQLLGLHFHSRGHGFDP